MNKLLRDTLMINGRWSRKGLTTLTTFIFVLTVGASIVISDIIQFEETNADAITIFQSLLLFLATLMGITEVGKKFSNRQTPEKEE